jgi:HK97 family phage portal protein
MGSLLGMMLNAGAPAQSSGPPVPMGGSDMVMPGSSAGANQDLALIRSYKTNGTVHSNVSLMARSVAKQRWNLYRTAAPTARYTTSDRGSDPRKQVMVHAALNVLNSPASITVQTPRGPKRIQVWSRGRLFQVSQIWMKTCGKSYWIVDTAEDASPVPLGLWPVRPDRIIPVPNRDRYLAGYLYRSPDGRETVPLRPDEVIVNRYVDPEDPHYGGCGPVQAVITDIQASNYAAEWNKNYFINSAEPGGVIQVPNEMNDEEFDQFTSRWRETHRGVARAHRIAVLEAGATWVTNSHSARDMDFVNLRNSSRDIIREALAMHKVMTGVTEDVNRANAQTGEEVFSSWTVAPDLEQWRDDVINTQFLPLFGPTAEGVEFDFSYPTPANREQDNQELTTKTTAYGALVTAGVDPDDAAMVVGLPPMKTVERAVQSPALPPGWVPEMGGAPDEAPDDAAVAAAERILIAAARRNPRAMAVYNRLQLAGAL